MLSQCHSRQFGTSGFLLKLMHIQITKLTRQAVYVLRNIESRSRDLCCHGRALTIVCSECVCVALVIWHGKRMRHIAVCVLPVSAILLHIIS